MKYVCIYYLIGVIISLYFTYYYRFSEKTKGKPKPTDAIGGIIGPWLFWFQIILHFQTRNNYKNRKTNK